MFSLKGGWGGANHFFLRSRNIVLEEGKGYMHIHLRIFKAHGQSFGFFFLLERNIYFIC